MGSVKDDVEDFEVGRTANPLGGAGASKRAVGGGGTCFVEDDADDDLIL